MSILTVLILFSDDVRVLSTDKNGDGYFYGISFCCLIIFSIEIFINVFSQSGYFNSFNFWLDLISTCSLILDIDWIITPIFSYDMQNSHNATQIQQQQSSSRLAQKITSVTRIIRLVRLIKLFKNVLKSVDRDSIIKRLEEEIDLI